MKRSFLNKTFIIALGLVLAVLYMPSLSADEIAADASGAIDMIAGDIQSIAARGLTRVSLIDPSVADISDVKDDKVTLIAKKAGETTLFLWDANGKRSIQVRVANEDLGALKSRVKKLLDEAGITGVSYAENLDLGKLVILGSLTKEDKRRMDDVLGPYSDNLLNLVKEEKNEDLIEVDMQVVEISTTLEEELGIQWENAQASSQNVSNTASTTTTTPGMALPYTETPPTTNGKIGDFFKVGHFNRNFQLQATVNALLQEGKARLISKPRLVAESGKQASFLVGGEIPIQNTTTSASGGIQQSSTTYTQYGVNMTVTPTIVKGKIDVLLNVDIRDVDNSSSFSTNSNVAFITRTASTELLMDNKQTIALAGLIKYSDSVTLNEVPFLSKIPILGALFRNRNVPGNTSTEMVIVLTPVVLSDKKFADKQVVMPTPSEREAWKDVIETKYPHEPLPVWPVAKTKNDNNMQTILPQMTAYARMVQEKISKAITYPHAPNGETLAGTVKLKLHILKDGSLDSEEVIQSSGIGILDQDALQAAKTAAPYNAFTTGMDRNDLIFTVPIVYNKLTSGGKSPAEKVIAAY